MKVYSVRNDDGYAEDFYSLPAAKKAMREHNAKGYITKIYANGDWENAGEIKLNGNNKTLIVGATKQTQPDY